MKYLIVMLAVIMMVANLVFAQPPDTLWTKTYGGFEVHSEFKSIQQTSDGGFICAGRYANIYDHENAYVVKTDSAGNIQWQQLIDGYALSYANSIKQTTEGNYIVAITFRLDSLSTSDGLIIKIGPQGNELWRTVFSTSFHDELKDIIQTANGNFVAVGYSEYLVFPWPSTMWAVAADSTGDSLWSVNIPGIGGPNQWVLGNGICETTNGDLMLVGSVYAALQDTADIALARISGNGEPIWQQVYANVGNDRGEAIIRNNASNYAIAGAWDSESALLKVNGLGDVLNVHSYGIWQYLDVIYGIRQTTDNGYLLSGAQQAEFIETEAHAIKTDSLGNAMWEFTVSGSGSDMFYDGIQTSEGGYAFCGKTSSWNAWVVMLESDQLGIPYSRNQKIPVQFSLEAFPNPFNLTTTISYSLHASGQVQLSVYDIHGRIVANLVQGAQVAGNHQITFNGSDMPSGIYLARLTDNNQTSVKKLVLVK